MSPRLLGMSCRYVQVEYGPMELDLNLRVRIHELEKHLADQVLLNACARRLALI